MADIGGLSHPLRTESRFWEWGLLASFFSPRSCPITTRYWYAAAIHRAIAIWQRGGQTGLNLGDWASLLGPSSFLACNGQADGLPSVVPCAFAGPADLS
jgi:hypothetical protein